MKKYKMRSTVIVPESVVKIRSGQMVATGETVSLPEEYGQHLVEERLAVEASDSSKKPNEDKSHANGAVDKMRKDELVAEAEKRGVEITSDMTKAEILTALQAAAGA
ncbi:hypothetical protein [Afifella sp. IM 167]|uniref:hypothetical protein n=1 Tax=Afifella sp. IM 167 TaxID=2033586 RepID=UPI001CCEC438|nr:hypothetical protein [Afifella sp. IM 167]MBZ8133231.1 hypothetical protein [Afifella sp. IM 167]